MMKVILCLVVLAAGMLSLSIAGASFVEWGWCPPGDWRAESRGVVATFVVLVDFVSLPLLISALPPEGKP